MLIFDGQSGEEGEEALHIEKCLLTLCYLVLLNVGNSITQIKYIAEVGTAGRYINRPVGVRRLLQPQARSTGVTYIPTARVSKSVCLFVRYPTT